MDGQQGAGMSKKERGNEAVRQFRKRKKVKEEADKEKAEMLRKENLELESRVASYQQVPDFSLFRLNFIFSNRPDQVKHLTQVIQNCKKAIKIKPRKLPSNPFSSSSPTCGWLSQLPKAIFLFFLS